MCNELLEKFFTDTKKNVPVLWYFLSNELNVTVMTKLIVNNESSLHA